MDLKVVVMEESSQSTFRSQRCSRRPAVEPDKLLLKGVQSNS